MIIHDFNRESVAALPLKANAPLIVNSDAVLPFAVSFKRFQPIARWLAHVAQLPGLIQKKKLSPGDSLNLRRKPPGAFVIEQPLGFRASKAPYHAKEL